MIGRHLATVTRLLGWPARAEAEIAARVARVEEPRLRRHVESITAFGPRSVHDTVAAQQTLDYLESELSSYGYSVRREGFGDLPAEVNLVVEARGRKRPDRVLELGAHHDTVPLSPGADDNASGLAGALEVARVLAGAELRRSIRICLFGREESGLHGSRAHVTDMKADGERVEGVLVFEMIGYRSRAPGSQRTPVRIPFLLWPPRTGDFIAVVSNISSSALAARFEQAAARHVPGLDVYAVKRLGSFLRDAARSDHLPYWRSGRRGIMITDTANFRNPNYHRPGDVPATLDYAFMADVTRAATATLLTWAL